MRSISFCRPWKKKYCQTGVSLDVRLVDAQGCQKSGLLDLEPPRVARHADESMGLM